ncbi:hypothetical protein DY000_02001960 [Brassica cretica]|uniref:Uncharacterized protein n=1 Tax=Brassica cretica TaxID=69181 RepID=A0ABQ7C853_BRACR|nr:hypothetical protein DY000_02001960 [Brassica cretica]
MATSLITISNLVCSSIVAVTSSPSSRGGKEYRNTELVLDVVGEDARFFECQRRDLRSKLLDFIGSFDGGDGTEFGRTVAWGARIRSTKAISGRERRAKDWGCQGRFIVTILTLWFLSF